MFTKPCNLSRAATCYGGGGGGGGLGQGGYRTPSKEVPALQNWIGRQEGNYNDYVSQNPLLNKASTGAQGFWSQLPTMLGKFQGFGENYDKFVGPNSALSQAYSGAGGIGETLASHGALSQDQLNAAIQQGRVSGSQSGSLHDPSAIIQDYTSRKSATDANFNQALAQSQGVLGQQSGAVGQQAGLLGQEQALQTGGLNQLLGVGNAAVSQYGGLTNPIFQYLGNLFGGNQQAAIAQAQVNAQQQAAGDSKKAGGTSAIGSIAAAAIPAIIGL